LKAAIPGGVETWKRGEEHSPCGGLVLSLERVKGKKEVLKVDEAWGIRAVGCLVDW